MEFSHLDSNGNIHMVDINGKDVTERTAVASGRIYMNADALNSVINETNKKGNVLCSAQIAGIMASKQVPALIPLTHNIALNSVNISFNIIRESGAIEAVCTAKCSGKTGVEMEAITGTSVALLTVYDMCKALDKGMKITDIKLLEKYGGKSGDYIREND